MQLPDGRIRVVAGIVGKTGHAHGGGGWQLEVGGGMPGRGGVSAEVVSARDVTIVS